MKGRIMQPTSRFAVAVALSFAGALFCAADASAAMLTVTSTADSGLGSLRQALADAGDGDTINGDYKFMVWAGDDEPDTFSIRIWQEDEATGVETYFYDNGFDQPIGGGSIVIHTK